MPIRISMTPEAYERARKIAFVKDLSVSRYLQSLIEEDLTPIPARIATAGGTRATA